VWDPREIPVHGRWFEDGPILPIEFARQSNDGRLTLVLVPEYVSKVRSLWTLFSVGSVAEAREGLRLRECVLEKNKAQHIDAWSVGDAPHATFPEISTWVAGLALDAAVWTALPPKFGEQEIRPSIEQAVAYLRGLRHEQRRNAERYVRMTPRQVDTPYRHRFEAELGWSPVSVA
jgi:hypothetical protein